MTKEQEYMYIIEYSKDPDKREAAARKLKELEHRKFTMSVLYGSTASKYAYKDTDSFAKEVN